ncbi:LLM class flavin-dependent oxidoreductase [Streptomyces sp. NPDC059468]|uniref:LLM class flavin-dependent oxidoreductase n=1 Tax=Streptomyces sp. NPDC059468 TaxID=3346845 RepID=UPI00368FF01F
MTEPAHWGVNLPLPAHALPAHRRTVEALPDLGYTDVWTGEGGGVDAFTPLAAAAAWQPRLRLGTGVVPVFTRGPGILAQTAAGLAALAEGRVLLGVGASVPAHTTALNGVPHERPLARVRDTVRFLKQALHGQDVGVLVGAEATLPPELVDALWLHGEPAAVRERIRAHLHPAVTTVVLYIAPTPELARQPGLLPDLLARLR